MSIFVDNEECNRWVSLKLCLKLEPYRNGASVLMTLKWSMQAVTPFSFIDNFLRKINADKVLPRSSIFRSTQLILSIRKVQAFLGCSSSENICCNRNSNSGH
ncbi:unnamed protein product [Camellia sinensis]